MTIYEEPIQSNEYKDSKESNEFHNLDENQAQSSGPTLSQELARKMSQLQTFGRDINAFINGFQLNIDRDHGAVQINLRKKTKPLVELIPLLQFCEEVLPLQAIIGWNKTQEPMIWSAEESNRHLLISGNAYSGKSGLLRSLILTLVLATRPSQLQLAIIDGSCHSGNSYDHSGLKKFSELPHLLNRPPANPDEVSEIVSFIVKEADHRLKHEIATPKILFVLDNLQDILPVANPEFHEQLEHTLDIGPEVGIQVVLATNRPEDGRLQDLISAIDLDRITGKVHSAGQAAFATGREQSEAEHLDGNGEFLATLNKKDFHFQAAWLSEKNLDRYLNHINQTKQPALLAWSIPSSESAEEFYDDGSDYRFGFLENDNDLTKQNEDLEHNSDSEGDIARDESKMQDIVHFETFETENRQPIQSSDEDFEQYQDDSVESSYEDRHSKLESIYTKLTGFWQSDPSSEWEEEQNDSIVENSEAEQGSNDFIDEWDLEDEAKQEHTADYAVPHEDSTTFIQEPKSDYYVKGNNNGWLDFASDDPNDEATDEKQEDELENHQQRTGKTANSKTIDESDPYAFSPENISQTGRRSRFSHAKSKPKSTFKPVPKPGAKLETKSTDPDSEEPIDPWQNGLETEIVPSVEKNEPPSIVRPPRLAQRKRTQRRRVQQSTARPKPKPKVKPAHLLNETNSENNNNGESE